MDGNKANSFVTINSIILSVVFAVLVRKEENPNLIILTIMLITVCFTTVVFAILATGPILSSRENLPTLK